MSQSAKLLVVDDQGVLIQATRLALEGAGYETLGAEGGAQGLRMAREHKPDLVLLAVSMPDISGLEVCRLIKADPELKRTFVIMLSGTHVDSDSRSVCLDIGADGYMTRPVANRELVAYVEAILRIRAAEMALRNVQAETQHLLEQSEQARHTLLSLLEDQKQVEEALRTSELRYRNLFERVPVGLYRTASDGRILDANPALAQMLGFADPAALAAVNVNSLYLDPTSRVQELALLDLEGVVRRYEMQYCRPDGSSIWVWDTVRTIPGDDGRLLYQEGSLEDITERKRAEQALRQRVEELAALQATVLEIAAPHDLPSLLRKIVERAAHLLHADSGGIYLCDLAAQEVRCMVSYNTPSDYTDTVLRYGEGAAGTVAQTGRPLIIDDYRTWGERAAVFNTEQPFLSVLSAPMIWQRQVIGVIHVLHYAEHRHFSQADLDVLTRFANHAAVAVENTRLYEQAQTEIAERKRAEELLRGLSLTDDLTGLYNRRGFLLLAQQQLKLAHRMKEGLLLLFGDLDSLKTINDTLGHAQGDLALVDIATVLKETCRESDIVARLGGDEFAVLAQDAAEVSAHSLLTRVEKNLEAHNARGDRGYKLAFSLGSARYDPETPCTVTDLLAQADDSMYQQKQIRKI